jgi:HK97 family phage prohead protease
MSELVINRALAVESLEPIGDGWTVYGMAVPYEREQRVSDDGGQTFYSEMFGRGAFGRDVAKGGRWVNLMLGHAGDDGDRYLGRCIGLTESDEGLFPSFRLDRTHPAAEAARAGELTKWSVSARVYRSRETLRAGGKLVVREACGLSHVAATTSPQYAGAGVLVAREHTAILPNPTPRLDALRKRGYGRAESTTRTATPEPRLSATRP